MKRFLILVLALSVAGVCGIQAQSSNLSNDIKEKAAEVKEKAQELKNNTSKKVERKLKREERKAKEQLQNEISFVDAVQAINDKSFVVEANSIQTRMGRVYFVTPTTNFVSLHDGQATVQIANSSSVYPGPNGLGGITVQGAASDVKITQDDKGNVNLSMSVQGIFISATVNLQLSTGSNKATVVVDPNFSGNTLTMTGAVYPSSMSNVFQGSTI